ncbi:MAG: HAMP domain-containing protein [Deltaproteobacteria bacterium]|nr:HAMP domain-containing protein [Deltaproteobacteria bacterium]
MALRGRFGRSLALTITVPTVLVVLGTSLASSRLLAGLFARTHERHAAERARHLATVAEGAFARAMEQRHDVDAELHVLCAASGRSVAVASLAGRVRFTCESSLLGATIDAPGRESGEVSHGGQRWMRHVRSIGTRRSCGGCHGAAEPVGHLVVDSPLREAEEEVGELRRLNVITDTGLAVGVAVLLVLFQIFLIVRPLRRLTTTVERIRGGDLSARAPVARGDEIGRLAQSLNEMAASLERAKVELDRIYRAELAQAEKLAALGQLTSSIAHEIKNPLAGIMGALRVVEAETPAPDPNKLILGKILLQMERLSQTAVSLLEFARPLRPDVRDVRVAELLERTIFFVARQAAEHKVVIRPRLAPDLPAVRVDPDLMKQVFLNLLLNGIQAMPRGGELAVGAAIGAQGMVDIAITDQGVGIPPENLERIFSPFFTTKQQGTGLGLYVARQIAETQGGVIGVSSTPGRGTTFTVRLPAAPPQGVPHGED